LQTILWITSTDITILKNSFNLSLKILKVITKWNRNPIIRKLVIRTANNPEAGYPDSQ